MQRGDAVKTGLVFVACLVVSVATYASILNSFFVADDFAYLDAIQQDGTPLVIFSPLAERYFRPAVVLVYYLNYLVSGLNPFTYHLSVVVIHGLSSFVLFLLAHELWPGGSRVMPAATALLFATFAGYTEAVTWIGGMADPLVTLFTLCALLAYRRAMNASSERALVISALTCFLLALFSKESAVVFPVMAVGMLVVWRADVSSERARRLLLWLMATVAIFLVFLLVRKLVLGFAGVILAGLGTNNDPVTMGRAFVLRTLLPLGEPMATFFRDRLDGFVLVPLAVVGFLSADRGRQRLLAFAAFGALCALGPVLPLSISLLTSESERLIYMASAFSCLFVVAWLDAVCRHPALPVAAVAMLSAWHITAVERSNQNWLEASEIVKSSLTSLGEVLRKEGRPDHPVLLLNLPDNVRGAYVFRRGFHEGLRIVNPDQAKFVGNIGVLSVYAVLDSSRQPRVSTTSSRSVRVDTGGWLIGPPTAAQHYFAIAEWTPERFDATFTPLTDGGVVVGLSPHTAFAVGRLPFGP